jgi:hypothetical protein
MSSDGKKCAVKVHPAVFCIWIWVKKKPFIEFLSLSFGLVPQEINQMQNAEKISLSLS